MASPARFHLRLPPFDTPAGEERLLDWAPGTRAATIEFSTAFLAGWQPTAVGADLLRFAAAAYCADRTVLRERSPDAWTRPLQLDVPATDTQNWDTAVWAQVLRFLTGDRWNITSYPATAPVAPARGLPVDAVSLFSGGLDSLCGVIDLLEQNRDLRLLLVAHHEGGRASPAQRGLFAALTRTYGDRVQLRRMFCRPAPAHPTQTRPLPDTHERTTRSRSLLFLAGALAAAAAAGPDVPVYVPENGWISLNVPLTRARTGSASTRTTHPHFLELLAAACQAIGVHNPIINPYRLQTKGQMLAECRNRPLLAHLARSSVSCAHPETPRWRHREQGNCGYCLPCLVRRAALAHIGEDRATDYAWDALTEPDVLDPEQRTSADLRATVHGVNPHRDPLLIIRNAPLPAGQHHAYLRMWRHGAEEIRTWLVGANAPLAQFTATAWSAR